jgi:predicted secreted protein
MSYRIVFVLAALLAALPVAVRADEPQPPAAVTIVHLSERAQRETPRDQLVLLLRAEATAKSARDAQAEVTRRMTAALDDVKKVTAVHADTPSMNIFEARDGDKPTGWRASESLRLRSNDFTAALALLGKLEEQGLLVTTMSFDVSPDALKGVEDALTAEALQRLRARADSVAADMGLAVDHLRSVQVGEAGEAGTRPWSYAIVRQRNAMPAPVGEAGEAPVEVVVSADVWLVPKR